MSQGFRTLNSWIGGQCCPQTIFFIATAFIRTLPARLPSQKFFTSISTIMISAIVTAYERIDQTLETLRIIQSCVPTPDEVLVHVDADRGECEDAICEAYPNVGV